MADCGTSGTTLDRAATGILSSVLGGGGTTPMGGQTTEHAGKAIGTFLGGVVSGPVGGGMMGGGGGGARTMPMAPPTILFQQQQIQQQQQQQQQQHQQDTRNARMMTDASIVHGGGVVVNRTINHQMDSAWNTNSMVGGALSTATVGATGAIISTTGIGPHNRMAPGMQNPYFGGFMQQQQQQQHQQQNNTMQMQMHMQMQAMNQQMAMMQMTQQQQRVNQMTTTSNHNNKNFKISSSAAAAAATATTTTESSSSYQYPALHDLPSNLDSYQYNDPIESALHDLPSNLDSLYRSAATAQQDVSSTTNAADQQYDDAGHEGYVEGASLDELATAWSEAERQIREDFEADEHLYGSGNGGATMEGNEKAYEFSPQSENYRTNQLQQPLNTDTITTTTTQANDPQTDLMAEGMSHFQSGNTPEAILCFESELRHIDPDNSDAWLMLGKCHAENDQDSKAIVCLERAVERDPYNGEALLALGVSYVNELNHGPALKCLKDWVTHNPNYAGMDLGSAAVGGGAGDVMPGVEVENDVNRTQMEELKSLLYSVVNFHDNPIQNTTNSSAADALEALGVVLNVSRDYNDAISCFERATTLRPDSYQLWNKLGATLANGSRSDEALPAYHKALALKPKYARVWLNMAISHSNLKNHDEAARCYLQTLCLNEDAVHIWGYLRVALTCGERWDLLEFAAGRDLNGFQPYFDFIRY